MYNLHTVCISAHMNGALDYKLQRLMGSQNKDGETQIKFYKKCYDIHAVSQNVTIIPSLFQTLFYRFYIHKEG